VPEKSSDAKFEECASRFLSDEGCAAERHKAHGGDIEAWVRAPVAEAKARTPAKRSPRSKA